MAGVGRIPRAPQVVALDVAAVEVAEDRRVVPAARGDVLRVGGEERAQLVALAVRRAIGTQLRAELVDERREVRLVVDRVDVVALESARRAGPLPVEVEAVEHARGAPRAAAPVDDRQGALDEYVDAARDELLARGIRHTCVAVAYRPRHDLETPRGGAGHARAAVPGCPRRGARMPARRCPGCPCGGVPGMPARRCPASVRAAHELEAGAGELAGRGIREEGPRVRRTDARQVALVAEEQVEPRSAAGTWP